MITKIENFKKEIKDNIKIYCGIVVAVALLYVNNCHILPAFPWLGFIENLILFILLFTIPGGIFCYVTYKFFIADAIEWRAIYTVVALVTLVFCALIFPWLSKDISDVPNLISANYKVAEGNTTRIKPRSFNFKDSSQEFTIQGIEFKTVFLEPIPKVTPGKYRVVYLPNSKYILSVEQIK